MNPPDWVNEAARYILEEGLVNTLKIASIALVEARSSASRSGRS